MKERTKYWLLALLLLLLLAACARDEATQENAGTATTTPIVSATPAPTATPTRAPTATPAPTPTLLSPAVYTIEQALDEDGVVVVTEATMPENGWVVVYADAAGEPGDVLGYAAVDAGTNRDIPVTVDPYLATPTLHVRLHQDLGQPGEFEYPGVDEPFPADEPLAASFPVDIQVTVPAITVADQEVTRDQSQIVVTHVTAPVAGWVVLYADDAGAPGKRLGQAPVSPGENQSVVINFDWRQATRPLHVVLYEDGGEPGRFEPGTDDTPFLVGETPVAASFIATLPEDVFVINQPATTGELYVERALINEPGWLAVYTDFSGYADRLLGYVPLEPGANDDLVVPIDDGGITPLLHIMLHEDQEPAGEFEHLGADEPLRRDGRMQLFTIQTNAGSYLETSDQPLDGDQVTVPLVVADVNLWLAIHATTISETGEEPGAQLGDIIGRTHLSPGVHRNVTVTVDAAAATPRLYAALYLDDEPQGEFEPDGTDVPLRFGSDYIRAPFAVKIEE